VRLVRTEVTGVVKTVAQGAVSMTVERIGSRLPGIFNFTGTGPSGSEADPADYKVDTTDIDLTGLAVGSPVRIIGFVSPFGSAPPDFDALTVVDLSSVGALMEVIWSADSDLQLKDFSSTKISIDLADSPKIHDVVRGGAVTDLAGTQPALAPSAGTLDFFAIRDSGTVTVFTSFAGFEAELLSRLTTGKMARRLCAIGHFDDTQKQLNARAASVILR
jgi:hypothetical protein